MGIELEFNSLIGEISKKVVEKPAETQSVLD
jgi:hypothetical protein